MPVSNLMNAVRNLGGDLGKIDSFGLFRHGLPPESFAPLFTRPRRRRN
jgi:hypothetical protein